jgi:protein SCO1/2
MYSTVSKPWLAALAAGILYAACPLAAQQDPHQHHHHVAVAETASVPATRLAIPDTPVLDQDGKSVRFYTDLVKGKVVAINFIFTTCTTICPPLAATFAHVQRLMGDRVGKDVHLISVSVDPVTDTPSRPQARHRPAPEIPECLHPRQAGSLSHCADRQ